MLTIKANNQSAWVISRVFQDHEFFFAGCEVIENNKSAPAWTDDIDEAQAFFLQINALVNREIIDVEDLEVKEVQIHVKLKS